MSEEEQQPEPAKLSLTQDKINDALLKQRRILIGRAFDNDLAEEVIKQLWFLEAQAPGQPILLVINSPGGSVDAGFAIWDQIKLISSPVTTLITGLAASMGSVVSLAAAPGRRFATPMSRLMIHQPAIMGVIQGQATDLEIHAREILKTKEQLIEIYVNATGKSREVIEKAIDRDTWMSAQEALEFGHINKIVTSFKDLEQ